MQKEKHWNAILNLNEFKMRHIYSKIYFISSFQLRKYVFSLNYSFRNQRLLLKHEQRIAS